MYSQPIRFPRIAALSSIVFAIFISLARSAVPVTGELKQWHKLTLDFTGPQTSEGATPNPFTNYRLDVTFTHAASGKSHLVPGYYAADGDAANTSATSGKVWRVHFAPDETGTWSYLASFRSGSNIATSTATGSSAGFFDGDTGSFIIGATDKTGRDFRGKGRLGYVGMHHLRFAGTGEYFMKAGVDAPENLLAYADFDGDFKTDGNLDNLVKSWAPHVADWQSGDPVWQGSKGKGLIGAINYLASEGLNSFSFLTLNINGDDRNVFPYTTYGARDRLDVSRLAQWETVFEHGTRKGMYLHFKTQENENQTLLDGGNLGNQRKLYYRELIARFSHHLALNWNLGEECTVVFEQKQAWARYIHDTDPYKNHIVIHNGSNHRNMMGDASEVTGFSLQMGRADFTDTFLATKAYVDWSFDSGKPWVVACDEPGDSQYSLRPDNNAGTSHTDARRNALWGNIMAGGAGCEFYFGYALPNSDLTCQDFRSRDAFWDYCRHALQFLAGNQVPFERMSNRNSLVSGNGENANRCLARVGDTYLVQLHGGGSHTLDLSGASGGFTVKWFNPRNGATVNRGDVNGGGTVNLGSPPDTTNLDWIVLVRSGSGGSGESNGPPVANAGSDASAVLSGASVSVNLSGSAYDDGLPSGSSLGVTWSRISGPAGVAFANPGNLSTSATFTATGSYVLRLTASDGSLSDTDDMTVTITAGGGTGADGSFAPTHDAYTNNGSNFNSGSLRVQSGATSRITYLQFDLSAVGTPSSAVLRLTEDDDTSSGEMTILVYAATSNNWTESGIIDTNAPSKGTLLDTFTGDITNGRAIQFDVSAHVTGPGIYSFIVETDSTTRNVAFASSENSVTANRPLLLITSGGGPVNQAPLATAGPDRSATLSGGSVAVQLAGSASDDGLPAGSPLETFWTVMSGPAAVGFADPLDPATTATFTVAGSYTLQLMASDGERTATDNVVITVGAGASNAAPQVSAGADRAATLQEGSATVALAGSATDDGLPAGSALSYSWSRTSGPSAVIFSSSGTAATNVTFTTPGNYVLRLAASDSQLTSSDEVAVTVGSPGAAVPTSFGASHDAYLQNGANYNGSDLRVESSSRVRVAYLQFDLSALTGTPATARLRLTEGSDTSGGTMTLRVFAAQSNNWTESGINGGNAPAKGAELASITADITNGKVVEFDVSPLVQGPGIYSFVLQADPSSRDVAFASSEYSTVSARPALVVTLPQESVIAASSTVAPPPGQGITGFRLQPMPGGRGMRLQFNGLAATRYTIERSTNLVDWETIQTISPELPGSLEFVDPAPPRGAGFYRVVSEP